jgi:glycosyltransferase involved in cell wall biosynthesis
MIHRPHILILHLEGNFNNNPTLSALVLGLCMKGVRVTVLSPSRSFLQEGNHPNMRFCLLGPLRGRLLGVLLQRVPTFFLFKMIVRPMLPKISANMVLGVDRDGIILAALAADRLRVPYALLSFEIFFAAETSRAYKTPEIAACRNIEFALVQDPLRGEKLMQENCVPKEKQVYAPVAGRGTQKGKEGALRQKFGLPTSTRIVLSMGSTADWALIPEIIDTVTQWPDDWCLIIHDRYGQTEVLARQIADMNLSNVYLSSEGHLPHEELGMLLGDADIGLGFYRADFAGRYTGGNLRHLGFSSGKISTYLQFGVPVLCNDIGLYSDALHAHGIGFIVSDVSEIGITLHRIPQRTEDMTQRCYRFFKEHLDANITLPPVIDLITKAAGER